MRLDIPKKEAYAIYCSEEELASHLECKPFIIETDRANLVWIEKSEATIVIRWRLYLQGFNLEIRHIPGTANIFADMLSRMYRIESNLLADTEETYPSVGEHTPMKWNTFFMGETEHYPVLPPMPECIKLAHVFNRKYCSARETRANLNKLFPGHRFHYKLVIEYCAQCPVCQKYHRGMFEMDILKPLSKHLKPAHRRRRVGIDTNFMSPPDKSGHTCIHVIVNQFTDFVALYPAKDHSANSAAQSLFEFFITYGSFYKIASAPGSECTAALVKELTQLLGTRQHFSMVLCTY